MDLFFGLFVLHTVHWAVETCVSWFLGLDGISAYAQYDADIYAVDEGGSTTSADEWKWLAGDRDKANGHAHVDHGLRDKQQGQAHGEEWRERPFTSAGYSSDSEEQEDIEYDDYGTTP